MMKIVKWTGIVFGGLIGLTVLAGLVLYAIGMNKLTQTYPDIQVETVKIPTEAEAIARGQHIATIWGCNQCHGEDLSGKLITNDPIEGTIPILAAIPAPNLTSGKGGIATSYTEMDWIRAIRHGVKPNSQAEIFMNVSALNDQDLGDLIAYLKQVPPGDSYLPAIRYGPILPIAPAVGMFTPAAELMDHDAPHPADVTPGATAEYGRYLSAICAECHGNGVGKAVKTWNQAEFIRTFDTGVLPNGRQLGPTMSSNTFRELNETELVALWLYWQSPPPAISQK